ncbi:MAG: energy transducer TonB [Bacteroidia bacterium]|nr:energy transducer TonB [Bacteroidia bacterium]
MKKSELKPPFQAVWKYLFVIPAIALIVLLSDLNCSGIGMVFSLSNKITWTEMSDYRQTDSTIFTIVEQMPQFKGGDDSLRRFLAKNIHYPDNARQNNIEDKVYVSFIVGSTGKVRNVKVVRGIYPDLNTEAIRVIKSMPDWIPGKQRGEAVNVMYTIPISFKLETDK